MYRHITLAVLCLAASSVACAPNGDDDGENVTEAQDDLSIQGVRGFKLLQHASYEPAAPPGGCRTYGLWTVDFVDQTLRGHACTDSVRLRADRKLSSDELSRIRTTLFNVKTTNRPASCAPGDGPSLVVYRGTQVVNYVSDDVSCLNPAIPVTRASAARMMSLLGELASVEPPATTHE
jgi:hypothetical protein